MNLIRYQLSDLERGIKGFVVMSSDLEEVFECIFEARVPPSWLKVRFKQIVEFVLSNAISVYDVSQVMMHLKLYSN